MCEDFRRMLIEAKAEPAWTPKQRERHRQNSGAYHARIDARINTHRENDGTDGGIYTAASRVLKPKLRSRNPVTRLGARSYVSRVRRDGADYADIGSLTGPGSKPFPAKERPRKR